jgi:outer membrane lipoprotein SlyB
MSLPNGEPSLISSSLASPQVIVSPSCSKALVFARGSSTGVLIGGLPSTPEVQPLNFVASGSIAGAAVGDLGDVALAVLRSDGSTAIQVLSSSGTLSAPLSVLESYGAMTFVPGVDTVLAADSGANRVVMLAHPSTNPSVAQLASAADGVSQPLAIASSADGREAFVANAVGVPLLRLDLTSTSTPAKVPCACRPSELVPLVGNALFQLSDLSTGTIYALDGAPAVPRTLFIPAGSRLRGAAR